MNSQPVNQPLNHEPVSSAQQQKFLETPSGADASTKPDGPSIDQPALPRSAPIVPMANAKSTRPTADPSQPSVAALSGPFLPPTSDTLPPPHFVVVPNAIPKNKVDSGITDDEIALYDRQIRLWGMNAQKRIQSSRILLITMRALGNEIAKNLVLAGIGSLTILDDGLVNEADFGAQFFLHEEDLPLGLNRAQAALPQVQKLNPRVKVVADPEGVTRKDNHYFANFDVIIATDLTPATLNFINTAARVHGKAFYAAGVHGLYGYIFNDLIEHTFVIRRDAGNVAAKIGPESRTRSIIDVKVSREDGKPIEHVTKQELYSTWFLASDVAGLPEEIARNARRKRAVSPILSCLRGLWEFQTAMERLPSPVAADLKMFVKTVQEKHAALDLPAETIRSETINSFLQGLGTELPAVSAVLGGQLAQDVINVRGQTQQPIQNMVIFDAGSCESSVYSLHPEGSVGKAQLRASEPEVVAKVAAKNGVDV
ncbi:E1 ubiquitin-activating protein aos1 [Ceratocystis pirilliformis]|uniref:Ubiquitin-like 1-activating enzyme E1A n=1 Tax=Ceratocystis pirilliformis TaxID=259994 RepID=A0ABR3YST9_9PEZI